MISSKLTVLFLFSLAVHLAVFWPIMLNSSTNSQDWVSNKVESGSETNDWWDFFNPDGRDSYALRVQKQKACIQKIMKAANENQWIFFLIFHFFPMSSRFQGFWLYRRVSSAFINLTIILDTWVSSLYMALPKLSKNPWCFSCLLPLVFACTLRHVPSYMHGRIKGYRSRCESMVLVSMFSSECDQLAVRDVGIPEFGCSQVYIWR